MVATATKQSAPEITALLGREATFDGKLTFEGAVRIDGKFRGEVFADGTLIVGKGAKVEAAIDVGEIIVDGTVVGNITAKRSIEIRSSGSVTGDVSTPALQIDKGAVFNGRSAMGSAVGPTRTFEHTSPPPPGVTPAKPTTTK